MLDQGGEIFGERWGVRNDLMAYIGGKVPTEKSWKLPLYNEPGIWLLNESGVSIHDYVSRLEKLFANLKNLDECIKDGVKAMILLHSFPEKYNHFVTTLLYGKSVIAFKEVCIVLTNSKILNNDKHSERASSEALLARERMIEKKKKQVGKNSQSKSRSRNIARDKCTFCHEKDYWKKDCLKA